jgi:gas vesicle protein GvpG
MFLLDSLLIGGIRFVLDKVSTIAEQELNDPERQRERLLEAQLKLETGEIDDAEFKAIEADVFERIREIKARTQSKDVIVDDEHRVAGVEITVNDDDAS